MKSNQQKAEETTRPEPPSEEEYSDNKRLFTSLGVMVGLFIILLILKFAFKLF